MVHSANVEQTDSLTLESLPPHVLDELKELGLPEEQILDILAAVKSGVKTPGEYLGMTEASVNTFERVALAYYRAKEFVLAGQVYSFIIEMFPTHANSWRGLGACLQSTRDYHQALFAYITALQFNPQDLPSQVFLGECYCLINRRNIGQQVLREALAQGAQAAWEKPYIERAQAILRAQTGDVSAAPQSESSQPVPKAPAAQATGEATDALHRDTSQMSEAELSEFVKSPAITELAEKLNMANTLGITTLKDIAGFTDEQLNGAYVAACRYIEVGQPITALQIVGWLIYLDGQNAQYYQLAGICAQHMNLHCFADYLHAMSLIRRPNDPTTLVYRGEAKIFSEERHAGVAMVRQGLALCGNKPELQEVARRAQALLKQFDNKARNPSPP